VKDVMKRRDRRTIFTALGVSLAVAVIAAPQFASAGHGGHTLPVKVTNKTTAQAIPVKGGVAIRGSAPANSLVESEAVAAMGLAQAEGSPGALAVRTFGGGGGFFGAGDCTPGTDPLAGDFLPNTVTVENGIITGIIITGAPGSVDAKVTVDSDFVNPNPPNPPIIPLLVFRADDATPQTFVGLGNGLTATDALHFTCTAEAGGPGNGRFVILGQTGI
jgi:hypothetical protein